MKKSPIIILNTGRCGSTMLSKMIREHPRLLSLSEFFGPIGARSFYKSYLDGNEFWHTIAGHHPLLDYLLHSGYEFSEVLYPFASTPEDQRFTSKGVPEILLITLPHLTDNFQELYRELECVIRHQPKRHMGEQYRFLFEWLCQRFQKDVWVERSGFSLALKENLVQLFPDAKIIHIYRDGRDTAISMSKHAVASFLVSAHGYIKAIKPFSFLSKSSVTKYTNLSIKAPLEALFWKTYDKKTKRFPLEKFGELWNTQVMMNQKFLSSLPPERLFTVGYEDLTNNPEERLGELIEFIHPDFADEDWIKRAANLIRPARSKYQDLDKGELVRLTEACKPGLEFLGYL